MFARYIISRTAGHGHVNMLKRTYTLNSLIVL